MESSDPSARSVAEPARRRPVGIGRWPFGLIAVAILRAIDVAAALAVGAAIRGMPLGELPIIASNPELTRAVVIILAVLTLIGMVGLLTFQRWGWILTLVLVGVSLAVDLIRVALGSPPYLALLLHVITAFYLNGRAVRALALAPGDEGTAPSPEAAGPPARRSDPDASTADR